MTKKDQQNADLLFQSICSNALHHDVIQWKHFPRYWPFVRGIHRFPVNSPHKGQWRRALMFSLICAWMNGWVNNREAGDLRRHRAHYDVTVMRCFVFIAQVLNKWVTKLADHMCRETTWLVVYLHNKINGAERSSIVLCNMHKTCSPILEILGKKIIKSFYIHEVELT